MLDMYIFRYFFVKTHTFLKVYLSFMKTILYSKFQRHNFYNTNFKKYIYFLTAHQLQQKISSKYQTNNIFKLENRLCRNETFYYKRSQNNSKSPFFVLGGIMSFFGLDEGSKRERQYEKEVDDMKEEDFDDKLKKILRPAIINIQV